MAINRRLTSYNVLSTHLADPGYFVYCKPEYLDPEYRFQGLCSKLERETSMNSIVCLQEVSHQWAGRLHTYFASKNYHFITALYGRRFNGYMGVAVAIPLDKYDLCEVDITTIADTKIRPKKPIPSFWYQWIMKCVGFFRRLFCIYTEPSYWDQSYSRSNQMICAAVKCKETNQKFVVGNYHMPCAFRTPAVMTIHCSLAAQHLQRVAKGLPFVYLGDFNIKPPSNMYKLLTTGSMEPTAEEMPVNEEGDTWSVEVEPMRSAYVCATGKEPDFTNNSRKKNDDPFVDTLDYIFISKHWRVEGVEPQSHRSEVQGPFPMKTEFSDHTLIAAELRLLD
jgi:2',5'-phosphodiesterase